MAGTFSNAEDATGVHLRCVTNGTISTVVDLDDFIGNGYILRADGDLSGDAGDTVAAATNIAYANGRITLTMTAGQKIYNLTIQKGALV